ncbi:hypothetical protein Gotri_002030, partial [Gossypium trilobum]|nr:hypothetical protein [Gossypium trilobum]
MEEDGEMTPFWLETSDSRRRKPSSFFLNTGILIILLLVIAFAFVLFVIPSFLSLTSNIFKPQLVKKSWDSVNLVLVLFAIICGFLSNSSNNNTPTPTTTYEATTRPSPKHVGDHVPGSNPATPSQWYDRTAYNSLRGLKSSSSYPDIRQEYSSWMVNGDDRWRFYDDTHLYNYRSRSRRQHDQQVYINNTKDIAVDTVCTSPQPPPQSPPPQLPKVVRRKSKRTHYEDAKTKERSERKEVIFSEMKISPPIDDEPEKRSSKIPPPPPPPPFKLRPWKFEVQGDFVRIKSINSADSDDPSSGEASPSDVKRMGEMEGEDSRGGALFCPSPDVNTKADHFIARFRA